jgi:hypothetical protein
MSVTVIMDFIFTLLHQFASFTIYQLIAFYLWYRTDNTLKSPMLCSADDWPAQRSAHRDSCTSSSGGCHLGRAVEFDLDVENITHASDGGSSWETDPSLSFGNPLDYFDDTSSSISSPLRRHSKCGAADGRLDALVCNANESGLFAVSSADPDYFCECMYYY